jgi:HK97 gp10 family phage protein
VQGLDKVLANMGRVPDRLNAELDRIVAQAGAIIQAEVRSRAPKRTGKLRESIRVETRRIGRMSVSAEVYSKSPVALWMELGAKAHVIHARSKKALFWQGARHPVRSVRHPGTAPRPFMRPGFEAGKARVQAAMRFAVGRTLGTTVM